MLECRIVEVPGDIAKPSLPTQSPERPQVPWSVLRNGSSIVDTDPIIVKLDRKV